MAEIFTGGNSQLANYSWEDIADGTGIVELDAFTVDNSNGSVSAAALWLLSKNPPFIYQDSETIGYGAEVIYINRSKLFQGSSTPATFSLSPFVLPRTVKGRMYTSFTWSPAGTAGKQVSGSILVGLYKNNDLVAQNATWDYWFDAAKIITSCVSINIPQTSFKIGDQLKVKFTAVPEGGEINEVIYLYHNPDNQNFTAAPAVTAATNPTKLKVYIPFKIDL